MVRLSEVNKTYLGGLRTQQKDEADHSTNLADCPSAPKKVQQETQTEFPQGACSAAPAPKCPKREADHELQNKIQPASEARSEESALRKLQEQEQSSTDADTAETIDSVGGP